ncbi:MAG: DUF1345 domain-containing protein [Xanthobacteraceae bacterium]
MNAQLFELHGCKSTTGLPLDKSERESAATRWREVRTASPLARLWRLHIRLFLAGAFGAAVTLALLALPWRMPTRIIVGWDCGVALYLALIVWIMARAPVARIRHRAAVEDEGAIALLMLTTASALASLAAVVAELGHAPTPYQVALAMVTILLSWAFMHTIFALHYAHEFYGEGRDRRVGGLIFPGDEMPDYWDFLYYSLVVAMTAQVSDVQITSKTIRRLTAAHGAVSFFFNVTVLALTVNLISTLM